MLVHVGIPVLDGRPYAAMVDSLLAETIIGLDQGVHLLVDWAIGNSLIGNARDNIVHRFLTMSTAECLVMLDADISWKGGTLIELSRRKEEVIGATYRPKEAEERYHVHGPIERVGDMYAVGGLPTGFLKIDRVAFGKINAPRYPSGDKIMTQYFPDGIIGDAYLGEDYGFCDLWRKAGGTVWLDPSIRLKHHDGGRFYTGDPRWWVDAQIRKTDGTSLKHCLDTIRECRDTPQTYSELICAWDNDALWPMSAEMLRAVTELARKANGPILEFGAGLSTLVMRAVSEQPIISFEHDATWGKRLAAALSDNGLGPVDLRVCPLGTDGFYATDLPIAHFALAVMDGPSTQEGRVAGLPLIERALRPGAAFAVDDLHFDIWGPDFRRWARGKATFQEWDSKNEKMFAIGTIGRADA